MSYEGPWLNFIGGKWLEGSGKMTAVVDPSRGEPFAELRDATPQDFTEAIDVARRAQPSWGKLPPIERGRHMRKVAELIRRDTESLAHLLVREQGKAIAEARGEVSFTADYFEYYAEFARRIAGEILPSDAHDEQIWTQRVPVGVVIGIIPWNFPAFMFARKAAPAIIAGNAIVVKPSGLTPLTALALAGLVHEAGLPPGVVNVVVGPGRAISQAFGQEQDLGLVTLTGSVRAGQEVMKTAAANITPISLELGGKAPFIVMDDADLDLAVRSAITARFMNCGQVCTCNERTLVHRAIYPEFLERFVEAARCIRVGDPQQGDTDMGPKISGEELEHVEGMVAAAIRDGARVATGGTRPEAPPLPGGYWYAPTVLTDVRPDMAIVHEEIFGPVAPVLPFDRFDDAVRISNASKFGLSAYLFTRDIGRIMRTVRDVEFGEIYVNRIGLESLQGFHGGYKQSGLGGDDGPHGLDKYLRKKTVYVNWGDQPATPLMPYAGGPKGSGQQLSAA